jgi:hypothetical protein
VYSKGMARKRVDPVVFLEAVFNEYLVARAADLSQPAHALYGQVAREYVAANRDRLVNMLTRQDSEDLMVAEDKPFWDWACQRIEGLTRFPAPLYGVTATSQD